MGIATSANILDTALAEQGQRRIEWALQKMPVLYELMERFHEQHPLRGTGPTLSLPRSIRYAPWRRPWRSSSMS